MTGSFYISMTWWTVLSLFYKLNLFNVFMYVWFLSGMVNFITENKFTIHCDKEKCLYIINESSQKIQIIVKYSNTIIQILLSVLINKRRSFLLNFYIFRRMRNYKSSTNVQGYYIRLSISGPFPVHKGIPLVRDLLNPLPH